MSLVARMVPGSLPAVPILLACAVATLAAAALPGWLALRRRRRAASRASAQLDPGTGLPSATSLARDLRLLSRKGQAAGTHLLALLEPPLEDSAGAAKEGAPEEERARRLARRLTNAVGCA